MDAFLLFGLLGSILPIGVLVLVLVAVLGGRYETDPTRERPRAIYLSSACFLGVFALLGALFAMVTALLGLTTDSGSSERFAEVFSQSAQSSQEDVTVDEEGNLVDEEGNVIDEESGPSEDEIRELEEASVFGNDFEDNEDITSAVNAGILALLALGILLFHDPKLSRLAAASRGPATRVYAKYLYLLCFIAVLIALGAGALALSSVFSALAPGVSGSGSRTDALRELGTAGVLALGAALIFVRHWKRADALAVVAVVEEDPPVEPLAPARGRIVRRPVPPAE